MAVQRFSSFAYRQGKQGRLFSSFGERRINVAIRRYRKLKDTLSTTPSKRKRVVDGACGSKFRIHARKRLPGTDRFGPVDCRIRANPVRPLSYRHVADSDGRVLDMEIIKQLQRFYVAEVFRLQPLIPGSQGSETVSLPYGTSAFDQGQCTTRVNRKFVKGISPSTHLRSRNPAPPKLALWVEYPSRFIDEESRL